MLDQLRDIISRTLSYYTYKIIRDVTVERLYRKILGNLRLCEPGSDVESIEVYCFSGKGCSAVYMGKDPFTEALLYVIGLQFGMVWMDVRFLDHDTWQVSLFEADRHVCSHSVNPWAYEDTFEYNQEHIDRRICRIRDSWPSVIRDLSPYLQLWRKPSGRGKHLVDLTGKAYPSDKCEYGDAEQINDFVQCFGLSPLGDSLKVTVNGVKLEKGI